MGLLSKLFGQPKPRQQTPVHSLPAQPRFTKRTVVPNSRPYLAFDIETAKIAPDDAEDILKYRPLGIACAATLAYDGTLTHWYSKDAKGNPTPQLTMEDAQGLVRYLQEASQQGYFICTWNGLGFDFDILAEESGMLNECRELALNHIDMMFHFFCLKGFGLGLDKVCRGMGIEGKPKGMSGSLIPRLWAKGKHKEVLNYLNRDVQAILAIAQTVDETNALSWISSKGDKRQEDIYGWLVSKEAIELPEPDTSWMDGPWPRSRFAGWTGYESEHNRQLRLLEDIKTFKREGKSEEAENLLLELVEATEAENKVKKCGVAPWPYEQLAIIYHKRKNYQAEINILERCIQQKYGSKEMRSEMAYRLVKAQKAMERQKS